MCVECERAEAEHGAGSDVALRVRALVHPATPEQLRERERALRELVAMLDAQDEE